MPSFGVNYEDITLYKNCFFMPDMLVGGAVRVALLLIKQVSFGHSVGLLVLRKERELFDVIPKGFEHGKYGQFSPV